MNYSLGGDDHEQHARNHNALDLLRNSSYSERNRVMMNYYRMVM